MAQPIIINPYPAEYTYRAGQALGGMVSSIGQSVEGLMFDYMQRKDAEKQNRLSVMNAMIGKYGLRRLGPEFAQQFEQTSGMRLPRDASGQINIPMTLDEQMQELTAPAIKKAIETDPIKYGKVLAGLEKPGMSDEDRT